MLVSVDMSRKGVSKEEKLERTKNFFLETKDVYLLKELEKLLPKQKGVISGAVKEVIDELVADGFVRSFR